MLTFSRDAPVEIASSADRVDDGIIGEDGRVADDFQVTDATDSGRFELRRAGELVGFATYHQRGETVVVPHVETLAQHRGQGFGARLMAGVVEIVRDDGRTVVPHCSFAARYFREHPDDADVVHRE
ncbi:MAG: GNAT family N-acetyltransferase [Ilumatobacteraceae bacterium]|nr:GNAT family N-acetyltransferase [Ilumatobacteraceae bacterium]